MSLGAPLVWTGTASQPHARSRGALASPLTSPPIEFRINLDAASAEPGRLSFPVAEPRGGNSHAHKALAESAFSGGVRVSRGVGRLMLASQIMIVTTLAILIFTLLFMSWRLNYNVNWYYEAATPYINEMANHSMGIMRHADASSESLEHVMTRTQALAGASIPEIMESVNRTAAMVARLQQVSQNPVIKLSMG